MKHTICSVFVAASLVASLAGCDTLTGEKADSPVIATVGKDAITENEFLREVGRVPEWARTQFIGTEGKEKFLDELVKRELIYQHARDMKLDRDKEYIQKVEDFEKMTLVSMVLKKEVEEKAFVDDAEVKAFFDQNEDKFTIGTELRASHILLETEDEAKAVYARINKGEDFGKLAKELSRDKGSAEKGGDLGFFGRGKMVPEFERAAAALKPGEVSQPVRTRFGYHIIKLMDIKKGEPANFEQSKESIKRQLLAEKRKNLFDTFVEKLKGDIKVTKDENALAATALPWETEEAPAAGADQPEEKKAE